MYDSTLLVLPTPTTLHVTPFGVATTTPTHVTLLSIETGSELWSFPFSNPQLALLSDSDVQPNANTNYYKVKSDEGYYTVTAAGKIRPSESFKIPKPTAATAAHLPAALLAPSVNLPASATPTLSSTDGTHTVTCYSLGVCSLSSPSKEVLWTAFDFQSVHDVRFTEGTDVQVLSSLGGLHLYSISSKGSVTITDLHTSGVVKSAKFDDVCGVFANDERWTLCGGEVKKWERVFGCFVGGSCLLRREEGGR